MANFELVVFPQSYLTHKDRDYVPFMKIINKSYAKPKFKYQIITTSRVKNPRSFVSDFQLDKARGVVLFVLLGPKYVMDSIVSEGYSRQFEEPANLEESFDCDIPGEYLSQLKLSENNLDIVVAGDDYNLDTDLYRVLGSVGYKTLESDESLNLELTAFTSFLRGIGPTLLELTIKAFVQNLKILEYHGYDNLESKSFSRITVHADVIRQHGLVEYYTSKCGFQQSDREDFVYQNDSNNGPFEIGLKASTDFNIAFIHRSIDIVDS